MNANHKSDITRRVALGTIAGLGAAGLVRGGDKPPTHANRPPEKMSKIEEEYRRLRPLFEEERKQFAESSNSHDYWKGPHGKAIIALGPAIIPYLIQELRKGDFFFNVPLARITNADITSNNLGSEQDNARLWLKWWDGGKERA